MEQFNLAKCGTVGKIPWMILHASSGGGVKDPQNNRDVNVQSAGAPVDIQ